jgi:hypothetical protein
MVKYNKNQKAICVSVGLEGCSYVWIFFAIISTKNISKKEK